MAIDVPTRQVENLETIQVNGNPQEIWGIKTAHSFRGYLNGRIAHFMKVGNTEETMKLKTILGIYDKFHPESDPTKIYLEPWKGKSGFKVISYPEYYDVIDYRKEDKYMEAKELHHKVYKKSVLAVQKALNELKIGDKVKTRDFGEIWARVNHIWENAEGKKIFENNGYNWSNIQGCRKTLFDLYYVLKVYEWYKIIEHKKSGVIIKLKEGNLNDSR